ncbi:MAG TPA: UDP-3-O-(3-hydroxymyristoyl)glucosamine N-acyltransferase [Rhizomicrobium sp.]|nr:UDP-3-O-(3-hydroxymyristoyl)glucosamine N-acyltransferase [Rhizomicrobium sp.]
MADPRFYDNRGPFGLRQICDAAGAALPAGADGGARVEDIASLTGAGPAHLTFYSGGAGEAAAQFAATSAGFCLVGAKETRAAPSGCATIPVASVPHAFARVARLFYPESGLAQWSQAAAIHPSAKLGEGAVLAPGVVLGPGVEIGPGTRIGPNAVIGRGVAIGRDCEIGSNVSISHAYVGDFVLIQSGAQIGNPGFGFASGSKGHDRIPQLGRVILQDRVEIGSLTALDRGALGDTVIGEGSKIDNLVQIGHNTRFGRHVIVAGHSGIAGSCDLGDFVILGGQVGIADHATIGDGARLAARTGAIPGVLAGGQDYGGMPAKPMRDYARELAAVKMLARGKKKT